MSAVTIGLMLGSTALPMMAEWAQRAPKNNAYGAPSGPLMLRTHEEVGALALPRHGLPHRLAPHRVNYRANIQALADAGVQHVVALHTVGGIDPALQPGDLLLPTDVIDYTYAREHTFFGDAPVVHITADTLFDPMLRERLAGCASQQGIPLAPGEHTYACTQGPRFETPAEVRRLHLDGATVVGMTALPEAALAKERGLSYASVCLVVNPAAGVAGPIDMHEVRRVNARSALTLQRLLLAVLESFVESS